MSAEKTTIIADVTPALCGVFNERYKVECPKGQPVFSEWLGGHLLELVEKARGVK